MSCVNIRRHKRSHVYYPPRWEQNRHWRYINMFVMYFSTEGGSGYSVLRQYAGPRLTILPQLPLRYRTVRSVFDSSSPTTSKRSLGRVTLSNTSVTLSSVESTPQFCQGYAPCHGRSRSKAALTAMTSVSANLSPTSCIPTGSDSSTNPAGTDAAG